MMELKGEEGGRYYKIRIRMKRFVEKKNSIK